MAKVQKFYEDNKPDHYKEGPFVMCECNGYRIEVQNPLKTHSTIPGYEVFEYIVSSLGGYFKGDEDIISEKVDHLNKMVSEGKIIQDTEGHWVLNPEL